jgi:hypothetical protein
MWSAQHTPPLKGVRCRLQINAALAESRRGIQLGVYVDALDVPEDVFLKYTYSISAADTERTHTGTPIYQNTVCKGIWDFFGLGEMVGGWDAAAWANKGLPTEGTLLLKLKVTDMLP